MNIQDNDQVRAQVRKAYAQVARGQDGCSVGCCGTQGGGSVALGYSTEELASVPEGADLGLGAVKPFDPGKRGAGDISFIAQYLDCLDGLGTMGGGAHSPQEYVDLRTFDEQVKKAALMIYRLTR